MTRPKLLLVDGSNVFVRAFSMLPEDKRTAEDIEYLVVGMLRKATRRIGATHLCVALDSIDKCWRFEDHPTYKEGRKHSELSPKQLTQIVGPALRRRGVGMLYDAAMEADDLLFTATRWAETEDCDTVIYTKDSDLYTLLDYAETHVMWPVKGGDLVLLDRAAMEAELGHPVKWLPMMRALTADRKDNMRGVLAAQYPDEELPTRCPITKPRALALLTEAEGNLWRVFDAAHSPEPPEWLKEKEVDWIVKYADSIALIWKLATLVGNAPMRVAPLSCHVSAVDLDTRRADA